MKSGHRVVFPTLPAHRSLWVGRAGRSGTATKAPAMTKEERGPQELVKRSRARKGRPSFLLCCPAERGCGRAVRSAARPGRVGKSAAGTIFSENDERRILKDEQGTREIC